MTASSLHIYSIPECLTDEETFDENEDDDLESVSLSKGNELAQSSIGLKYFSNLHRIASSCNDINLATKDFSKESHYSQRINTQASTSLLDFRELYHISDSGTLENDNTDLFTNAASFNKIVEKRVSKPYLKIEDYNSNGNSAYEKLLVQSLNSATVPQQFKATSSRTCMSISDDDSQYETILPQSPKITTSSQLPRELNSRGIIKNRPESHIDPSSKPNSNIEIKLGSDKQQSLASTEIPYYQQHGPRGRSGSVQWIQNIFHNFDQKCKSFLDLRRPSDIAEAGIRNSNEELETMEDSDEESLKHGQQCTSGVGGGRRFSENVIGKQQQKKFPFSSGFGHLKGLWKDRNYENNKKHDEKDIDQLRPDVCPLFNFPKKIVDEDEMILDALSDSTEDNINNQILNSGSNTSLGDHAQFTQISNSENDSSREEHVLPTPLLLHLNGSTVQLLIQEANSAFVSNTSFSDLVNDNATQQMLLRYRERKRQDRILTIQRDILQMLGLTHGPNVTARLSAEERQSLIRSFGRTMVEHTETTDNGTACVGTDDDFC